MKLSELLTEAVDLRCPNCGENLGKDTENSKLAYCGTCGEDNIKNPRGYEVDKDGFEVEEEETFADRVKRYREENKAVLDDSRKRKMARKYAVHGPSRRSGGVRRRGTGRPLGSFGMST